jgi:hypothetical protein
MDEYLQRDKISFEKYAIRYALIVLKHSVSMEEFNFKIRQLGYHSHCPQSVVIMCLTNDVTISKKKNLPYQPSVKFWWETRRGSDAKSLFLTGETGLG